ncbi:hypothetical protein ACFOLJ_20305 [Rugamonas sp. CCM 8940]|uniref:hypothetical protein n=1 Tax=Rugamonas sp. CCM 8940 TaxID=2765359 RepID=UPI0018F7214C|nr:hypothetical protein [Rugamonas sp. CCM 8940]MBJ7309012.1 hypothetical protein [Rugamonas sp. CCM 8940]
MSTIPALGTPYRSTLPALLPQADDKSGAPASATGSKATKLAPLGNDVTLSPKGVDLQKRVDSIGNATVDLAQNLLGSFAQALFGDAGKGAQISFDSVSLDTSSSYGAILQHSSGPNGSTDTAAFQLSDSSHFLGKGTITTADGRKFDFEVEVQYEARVEAGISQTSSAANNNGQTNNQGKAADGAKPGTLPTVQLPNIDFPGSLADLFKLIGQDLSTDLLGGAAGLGQSDATGGNADQNQGPGGSLTLRLLKLIDSPTPLDLYAPPNTAESRAKALADSYANQPGAPATPPALTSSTPAATTAPAGASANQTATKTAA